MRRQEKLYEGAKHMIEMMMYRRERFGQGDYWLEKRYTDESHGIYNMWRFAANDDGIEKYSEKLRGLIVEAEVEECDGEVPF